MKKLLLLLCTFFPSSLRLWVWRRLGFQVGVGCRVAPGALVVADEIALGHGSVIETLTLIFSPKRLVLEERARIASFVRVIGYGDFRMKDLSFIALGCLIDTTSGFTLGERSCIGPRSTLYTHGATALTFSVGFGYRNGPITIGDDTWISMGCIVFPRITIGSRALLSPGTVVSANVADDTGIFPSPASQRVLKSAVATLGVNKALAADESFEKLAGVVGSHVLDRTTDDRWILELPGRGKVVFIRKGEPTDEWDRERTLVWRLRASETRPRVPTVELERLTVVGGWTPFADSVAAVMCDALGIHVRFEER